MSYLSLRACIKGRRNLHHRDQRFLSYFVPSKWRCSRCNEVVKNPAYRAGLLLRKSIVELGLMPPNPHLAFIAVHSTGPVYSTGYSGFFT
jgi:hypothetical protein